jgi:hypothetical protein
MQFILIVGLCVAAAIGYGVLHDQITARICIEYFTIGHPQIIASTSPTVLGIFWGLLATWWVGLILGLPLAMLARMGTWPKLTAQSLRKPILHLLAVMAVGAYLSGIVGWRLASKGILSMSEYWAIRVPASKHVAFLAVWLTHLASYFLGFAGGIVVIILSAVRRHKLSRTADHRA